MPAYAEFAGFYDQVMGDRGPAIERVRDYVAQHHPSASTLLELGCGTGAVLAGLAGDLAVTGVDQSPEMLALAARAVPAARLVQADFTEFSLGTRFDVAICVFDTINHLPRLESWRQAFWRVAEHLNDGGLFVFDVNTTGRLRRLWRQPSFAMDFGEHTMLMDVRPAARQDAGPGAGELSMWTVRIFERTGDREYRLHREDIPELAVPLATIRQEVALGFDPVREDSLDHGAVSDESDRVFFVLRRRAA